MALEFVASKLAEAIVSQTVQRISDLLIHEATSLNNVREEVQSLQTELTRIKCFLEDADRKQEQDKRVQNWVKEVEDVACEIEDALETYIYKAHSSSVKAPHLSKLRTQIDSIKDKLRSIRESRQAYQIEFTGRGEGTSRSLSYLRRSYPDDDEDDVITLKDTIMALKAQLMKEEDRLCIVSIVGMGGLGKTTLAKMIYNDLDVKRHFDCHAWVFISQQYVPREVLIEVLMQVGFQSDRNERRGKEKYTKEFLEERKKKRDVLKDLEDRELVDLMKTELEDKRYLVVFDDIWSIDAWYGLRIAFPKGKIGSKVIFTTRIREVALSADPYSSPIEPPLLTFTESWELLQRKAFPREFYGERGCPSEFVELGKEMVAKCRGLPLAVVVLGGLLRSKSSKEGWKKVQKDVRSHFINKIKSQQQYRVEDILHLSFQDLPYYLKPCFLYLARFPEDSEIPKGDLILLWIAEGFIPTVREDDVEGTSPEDIAEQCLGELIDRCMIQVSKKDRTGKGVKTCRLHDLMRDFCISKAKEELFLELVQPSEVNQFATTARSRRIAVHDNRDIDWHAPWVGQVHSKIRSLLCFVPISSLTKENFLLLRVLELHFQGRRVPRQLPNGTGNLIHLRYLKVCGLYDEFRLPNSIGNLQNLQTLDLGENRGSTVFLPSTMSRLRHLRHLLLPSFYSRSFWAMGALLGNGSLKMIVTLKGIEAKHLIRGNEVLPLSNIRVLHIKGFKSGKEVTLVLNSINFHSQLGSLQSLAMDLGLGEFPNLEMLSRCHVLSSLTLTGNFSRENLTFLPQSLTKVRLSFCLLSQHKIEIMEKLPNLKILECSYNIDIGRKFLFSVGGFPKLEILTLSYFIKLDEWEVEEGAMPRLKRLTIDNMKQLKMIPEGLKHVTTLRELNISSMPKKFADRLRESEGEDFYKVSHIPSISISHTLKK